MVRRVLKTNLSDGQCCAFSAAVGILLLSICNLFVACRTSPTMDDAFAKGLLEAQQRCCKVVIGQNFQGESEYLETLSDFGFRNGSLSLQPAGEATSLDLTNVGQSSASSSDGQWNATCGGASCTVSSATSSGRPITISRKGILTPLFWSPDKSLIFYLVKGPKWRMPPRCSLEDERDIVLIEVASGRRGVVDTICGGFPYWVLRWVKLP